MKKIITLVLVAVGLMLANGTFAQGKLKLGHLDFGTLYTMMPGLDSVRIEFEAYNKSVQETFAAMQTELENKFMEYQANADTYSDIIRQTKEAEINDLQKRLETFEQTATQDLQNKEIELTQPIIEKARVAVEEVAKENGYTYILNSSEGLLLYAADADNIMDLVKAKLGITKPTPTKGGTPALDIAN